MKEEFIRRFDQTIVGIIQYMDNGDVVALEFPSRKIVGIYKKAYDHTIEFPSRRILTKGNTVISLIMR